MSKNNVLIICGPTATGKTSLAFDLAKQFDGELVSADSRQIYKGLNLLTGKDIPKGSIYHTSPLHTIFGGKRYSHGYYAIENIRLWMVDETTYEEEYSVGHYQFFAKTIIDDILKRKKLPILVGGTGLYIQSIVMPFSTALIPPNGVMRKKYVHKSVRQLQDILKEISTSRLEVMNNSDKHNPRRLIRAIEITTWVKKHTIPSESLNMIYTPYIIGLTAPVETIKKKIKQRIVKRWNDGALDEVKNFLEDHHHINMPLTILGFGQINKYLAGSITKKRANDLWLHEELSYAKRQLTWCKKQKNIHWFDIQLDTCREDIYRLVQEWYTKVHDNESRNFS